MPAADRIQCIDDARRLARRRLPRMLFDFFDGAAGDESAMALNRQCLERVRLLPRVLVDVGNRRLAKRFLDDEYALPFGISPMGMCGLAWAGADRSLAAVARAASLPVCVSTAASMSLEAYRRAAGDTAWFQLYVTGSVDAAMGLVGRAAAAGYRNLVFTVDTPVLSHRPRELRSGFRYPFRMGLQQFVDCALHPHWSLAMLRDGVPGAANFTAAAAGVPGGKAGFDRDASRALDLGFLARLRDAWRGRLIVKGVMAVRDAMAIADAGADAIWVSNHGGRQLDSAPAAITALGPIRAALGSDYPLVFDSGVRSGDDIVRALALGADFVMMGRPFLYALGAAGEAGLRRVVALIGDEVSRALAQVGCSDVNQVDASVLAEIGGSGAADATLHPPSAAARPRRSQASPPPLRAGENESRRQT